MKIVLFLGVVSLVLTLAPLPQSLASAGEHTQGPQVPANSLEMLVHKTGWIPLGDLMADLKRWGAGWDDTVPYMTGTFEILGRKVDRRKPILPKLGERIRLTVRVEVIILDYATNGEEYRPEPPGAKRGLERGDRTGLYLERGDVVQVRAVYVAPAAGQLRAAFARVSPVTK